MSKRRHSPRSRITGWNFHPPHCPNRDCGFYSPQPAWKWRKSGSFRHRGSRERFQCFRCRACGRYFSVRTFAGDYWLKRRDLFPRLVRWSCEGPGLRQTARNYAISHPTVLRHWTRAARYALLFHGARIAAERVREPLVIDGFESFEYAQYFPFHLNLAVGAESWFLYGFTDSPLRRKGRMTTAQKRRRGELERQLGRPDPKAIEQGVVDLLRPLVQGASMRELPAERPAPAEPGEHGDSGPKLTLHSDDFPAYPRALRRLTQESGVRFLHQVTSGRARRTQRNPLFPVNLADLLLRHSQANHRRETVAFSKRRQGAIDRAALFLFWRNYIKRRREQGTVETAAMRAGWSARPLRWSDLLSRRRFVRPEFLPGPWWRYYWHEVKTDILGDRQHTHRLKYAF